MAKWYAESERVLENVAASDGLFWSAVRSEFRRKLRAYRNLRRLITWEEWDLLQWSGRKFDAISAEHGIGARRGPCSGLFFIHKFE